MHVLVTGASGSGTTTLGRALAQRLGAGFADADDFYWLPTDPAFTAKRDRDERDERAALLRVKLAAGPTVVGGSIMDRRADAVVTHVAAANLGSRANIGYVEPELRSNDGREFDVVKVFHDPQQLTERLSRLGWRFNIRETERCFVYGDGPVAEGVIE